MVKYFFWSFYHSIWTLIKSISKWRPFQKKYGILNSFEINKIFNGFMKSSVIRNRNNEIIEKRNKDVVVRYDELYKLVRYFLLNKLGNKKNKKGKTIDDLAQEETVEIFSRFKDAMKEGSNYWYDKLYIY